MRLPAPRWDDVVAFENLLAAANKAGRGKRGRPGAALFFHRLEHELWSLHEELTRRTYLPGGYRTFVVHDRKPRTISAAPFRDRVVHHALCRVLEPVYERRFIHDSYACRKGKGTHAAVDRLQGFLRKSRYVLKCDLRKYFPSIDHEVLRATLRRTTRCEGILWLLDTILAATGDMDEGFEWFAGDSLFTPTDRRRGLPLGNQTSQFLGNVHLDPFDHFVKEVLRCPRYVRYVDDFVLCSNDKMQLHQWKQAMDVFLASLRLRIHPRKWFVQPSHLGLDFLGFRVFPDHRRLRPTSVRRFDRRLRTLAVRYSWGECSLDEVQRAIAGWLGHASHADTWRLRERVFDGVVFRRAFAE